MAETTTGLSLKRNILWNSVGSTTRLACNYLITIAVVRLSSGFDAAGALALAMTISNLIAPLADFRLRTIQVTDVAGERTTHDYVGLRMFTTLIAAIAGSAYAALTVNLSAFLVVFLYLVYSLTANFIEVMHAVNQRYLRMDYSGRSYIFQGLSNLFAFSLILWLTNSLVYAVVGLIVTTAAVAVFYDFPRTRRLESLRPAFDLLPALKLLLTLLPLALAQMASSSILTIPRQHLAVLSGEAALGIYAAVATPAVIIQMGASFIYTPLMGELAQRFAQDKKSALKLLRKTYLSILVASVAISVFILIFGDLILQIMFGEDILAYTYLLLPAIVCTAFTAIAWFTNDVLLTLRDFKSALLGNAIPAVVTLLISSVMVENFGMNGVSFVGIIAYALACLLMAGFLVHNYRKL
ncbi:polysaccharide biosynthesis protein [Trueperella pyogenes]|uniref:polysaccharide biosynthesis protein n=1 Tax=Trueperella pyogenes TaxID=1661 RepID=UPI00345D4AA8